ncbi:MAG TPA: hypothetical protein DEH22_05785 [Chloroflexi bacterium]|nr:hypothetical protein [Chloroflexota bacterium]
MLFVIYKAGYRVLVAFLYDQNYGGEVLFVFALAAFFPISYIAYQAFQGSVRQNRLIEDFGLLGYSESEAVKQYREHYGFWNYTLHVSLTVLVTIIGAVILLWDPSGDVNFQKLIDINTLQALRFGFLGAYVFSMQLVYRRYTTYDLQPTVYMYCVVTMIAALSFNFVAFEAISNLVATNTDMVQGIGGGLLAIIAFCLGYFPYLAIQWFNRISNQALSVDQRRADQLPLSLMDGISQWHETRLRDNGIDNVQNLASVDIPSLLVNTTFSAQQVIDWVDQAILYLYLESTAIDNYRRSISVRTISDFRDFWEPYYGTRRQERDELARLLQSTAEKLDSLYRATNYGPNLHFVREYWENAEMLAQDRRSQYIALKGKDLLKTVIDERLKDGQVSSGTMKLLKKLPSDFRKMIEYEPELQSAPILTGYGNVLCQDNDYDEAIKVYKQAIELDKTYAPAYNQLAWLYADVIEDQTCLDDALDLANKAVELTKKEDAASLDTLAAVQIKLGQFDEARENLLRAKASQDVSSFGRSVIDKHLKEVEAELGKQALVPAPENISD